MFIYMYNVNITEVKIYLSLRKHPDVTIAEYGAPVHSEYRKINILIKITMRALFA